MSAEERLLRAQLERLSAAGGTSGFAMTGEERHRVGEALGDAKFREGLMEYMRDMMNPAYRAEQEAYLSQLEAQSEVPEGMKLVRPTAGFAVATRSKYAVKGSGSGAVGESKDKRGALAVATAVTSSSTGPVEARAPASPLAATAASVAAAAAAAAVVSPAGGDAVSPPKGAAVAAATSASSSTPGATPAATPASAHTPVFINIVASAEVAPAKLERATGGGKGSTGTGTGTGVMLSVPHMVSPPRYEADPRTGTGTGTGKADSGKKKTTADTSPPATAAAEDTAESVLTFDVCVHPDIAARALAGDAVITRQLVATAVETISKSHAKLLPPAPGGSGAGGSGGRLLCDLSDGAVVLPPGTTPCIGGTPAVMYVKASATTGATGASGGGSSSSAGAGGSLTKLAGSLTAGAARTTAPAAAGSAGAVATAPPPGGAPKVLAASGATAAGAASAEPAAAAPAKHSTVVKSTRAAPGAGTPLQPRHHIERTAAGAVVLLPEVTIVHRGVYGDDSSAGGGLAGSGVLGTFSRPADASVVSSVRPKYLVVRIRLPLVASAKGVECDAHANSVTLATPEVVAPVASLSDALQSALASEAVAAAVATGAAVAPPPSSVRVMYRQEVPLPLPVLHESPDCSGRFDRDTRTLTLTLPVAPPPAPPAVTAAATVPGPALIAEVQAAATPVDGGAASDAAVDAGLQPQEAPAVDAPARIGSPAIVSSATAGAGDAHSRWVKQRPQSTVAAPAAAADDAAPVTDQTARAVAAAAAAPGTTSAAIKPATASATVEPAPQAATPSVAAGSAATASVGDALPAVACVSEPVDAVEQDEEVITAQSLWRSRGEDWRGRPIATAPSSAVAPGRAMPLPVPAYRWRVVDTNTPSSVRVAVIIELPSVLPAAWAASEELCGVRASWDGGSTTQRIPGPVAALQLPAGAPHAGDADLAPLLLLTLLSEATPAVAAKAAAATPALAAAAGLPAALVGTGPAAAPATGSTAEALVCASAKHPLVRYRLRLAARDIIPAALAAKGTPRFVVDEARVSVSDCNVALQLTVSVAGTSTTVPSIPSPGAADAATPAVGSVAAGSSAASPGDAVPVVIATQVAPSATASSTDTPKHDAALPAAAASAAASGSEVPITSTLLARFVPAAAADGTSGLPAPADARPLADIGLTIGDIREWTLPTLRAAAAATATGAETAANPVRARPLLPPAAIPLAVRTNVATGVTRELEVDLASLSPQALAEGLALGRFVRGATGTVYDTRALGRALDALVLRE